MGLISPAQVTDGSTAHASDVNNPINTIANEFNGNIDNANIKAGAAIGTAKLASDNGITAGMIAPGAITLGYAQITANVAATSTAQATGLTVTVTIPAGSRRIRISVWADHLLNNIAQTNTIVTVWDGAVNTGTQLAATTATAPVNNGCMPCYLVATVIPSAGSKTYNVGLSGGGNTGTIAAATTSPAFILVEAI